MDEDAILDLRRWLVGKLFSGVNAPNILTILIEDKMGISIECSWRILDRNIPVAESKTGDVSEGDLKALLGGRRILDIKVTPPRHSLRVTFDGNLDLEATADSDIYENWHISGGPNRMIVSGPGESWSWWSDREPTI